MAAEDDMKRGFPFTSLLAPVVVLLLVAIGGWMVVSLGHSGRLSWSVAAAALAVAALAVVYLLIVFVRIARREASWLSATPSRPSGPAAEFADKLTGLATRLWFESTFASEIARSRRYRRPLSLVILDVDHFARINRSLGETAGDQILASIAQILTLNVRQSDHLARIADDEFAILVSETNEQGALSVAEKLRRAIEQHEFEQGLRTTVSAGVATVEESDSVESFLRRGEAAAMTARRGGGNAVATATF